MVSAVRSVVTAVLGRASVISSVMYWRPVVAGELAYVSGLTGKRFDVSDYETVDFEGALELRGREWD